MPGGCYSPRPQYCGTDQPDNILPKLMPSHYDDTLSSSSDLWMFALQRRTKTDHENRPAPADPAADEAFDKVRQRWEHQEEQRQNKLAQARLSKAIQAESEAVQGTVMSEAELEQTLDRMRLADAKAQARLRAQQRQEEETDQPDRPRISQAQAEALGDRLHANLQRRRAARPRAS